MLVAEETFPFVESSAHQKIRELYGDSLENVVRKSVIFRACFLAYKQNIFRLFVLIRRNIKLNFE